MTAHPAARRHFHPRRHAAVSGAEVAARVAGAILGCYNRCCVRGRQLDSQPCCVQSSLECLLFLKMQNQQQSSPVDERQQVDHPQPRFEGRMRRGRSSQAFFSATSLLTRWIQARFPLCLSTPKLQVPQGEPSLASSLVPAFSGATWGIDTHVHEPCSSNTAAAHHSEFAEIYNIHTR